MEDAGDANSKVLRVRALLKRGGKTPVYNTIVRTENVVATSPELQKLSADMQDTHRELAERFEDTDIRGVVYAVNAARAAIGASYGICEHGHALLSNTTFEHLGTVPKCAWPPKYAVNACGKMCVHAARLEALCHSFATKHRQQPNVENDVSYAISDTVAHLQDTFEQLDDEVFSKGMHSGQMEIAARVLNRRARQLAERATLDAHGEVFASIEFAATCSSLLRAASTFNSLHIGHSLYSDIKVGAYLEEFTPSYIASESHMLLSQTLRLEGLNEAAVTNTLARAKRHCEKADAVLAVEDARDPLQDTHVNTLAGQPLTLGEWAAEAQRTGVAQFDVIGGFSMSLEGECVMHEDALAEADWLCLRARTTCSMAAPLQTAEIARVAATSAWRRMRYDAGTYDAPFFRPSEEHLRAAGRLGIALCGRGNLTSEHHADADVLVVDTGSAAERFGMVVVGNHVPAHVTMHNAEDAVGYMFSDPELNAATDGVDVQRVGAQQWDFLSTNPLAAPAAYVAEAPLYEVSSSEVVATNAPLPTVHEATITAHEAYEKVLGSALLVAGCVHEALPTGAPETDAEAVDKAMRAALCVTIKESPLALNDLSQKIALTRSALLYRMLGHHGGRAVDVAASILGLPDLELIEAETDEVTYEHVEGTLEASLKDVLVDSATPVDSIVSDSESNTNRDCAR